MQWMGELSIHAEPLGTEVVGRRSEGTKQDHTVESIYICYPKAYTTLWQ